MGNESIAHGNVSDPITSYAKNCLNYDFIRILLKLYKRTTGTTSSIH
jgi:hypothetical protein